MYINFRIDHPISIDLLGKAVPIEILGHKYLMYIHSITNWGDSSEVVAKLIIDN